MIDDARTDAGSSAFRGFLFSDVRGFTAFAERYGNAAAADRVSRFLEIARRAISKHEGAEIKTEGDAIHAVFPSASSAVLCGLEIVDSAAELNERDDPEQPLGLGVGVHAGEAVETAEGYIGTAVNLAARLCAAAMPGEVLVTSAVKGMTEGAIPVGYIARGRRRLKGIREPVDVFAASRDLTARAARAIPGSVVGSIAGIAITILLAVTFAVGTQVIREATASPEPTPAPTPNPVTIGPLAVGTYAPSTFEPRFTFGIPSLGWSANGDSPVVLSLIRETDPPGNLSFLDVDQVIESPCVAGGTEGEQTGPAATHIIETLRGLKDYVTLSDEHAVEVGGLPGREVDVSIAQSALAACGGLAGAEVSVFAVGEDVWGAAAGERFRLVTVDVRDRTLTIVISSDWSKTPSVQQLEQIFDLGQQVVDTVTFESGPVQTPTSS